MTNGVFPCHVSAYKSYMPLTFDGGASSLCKSLFTPGDFISRSWNGCILVQKTVATQSVDYSCLFRVMSGNARITLMVRTGGAVYLALRSSSGDVQRICQTTGIPTLGNVMHIGYSWDGSRLALSVYDTTANTLVQVVESSTNVTSLPAWTEEDGIYVGNRADLSLPYKGNIYGGTFGYGVALSGASMAREAAAGNMAFGTRFIIHPQVMGLRGTGVIREPNHHDITVLNPDKTAFWNLNAPSSVIQEWWRFIPTIADIPQDAVVLDTDGVVKRKTGDYLVDIQYNVIGSGPLASAPAASVANLGLYYLETGNPLWPNGRLWLYRRGLINNGSDSVVISSALSNIVKLTSKFTIVQFCTISATNSQILMAKGQISGSLKEVGMFIFSNTFYGQIGGASVTLPATIGPVKFVLSNNLTSFTFKANSASVSGGPGSSQSTQPVMLFKSADTLSVASFGCYGFDVYSGANADGSADGLTLAASWRLDEPAGSTQVVDRISGLIGEITDASPTGFVGVPMLVPAQW